MFHCIMASLIKIAQENIIWKHLKYELLHLQMQTNESMEICNNKNTLSSYICQGSSKSSQVIFLKYFKMNKGLTKLNLAKIP